MSLLLWVLFLLGNLTVTKGDYPCFCNYEVELKVLPSPDASANPLGFMYEFDCKEILENVRTDPQWIAIAFEHKIGYVEKGQRFDAQTCQGQPSVDDLVTTTVASTAAHTSRVHTSPDQGPTTTTAPMTMTTVQTTSVITSQPTTTTISTTTPAPTITTTTPAPTTTTTTPKPTTTTTTLAPVTTTIRPYPIMTQKIVPTTMTPAQTTQQPTTAAATASSPVPNPTSGFVSGHTELCPSSIHGHIVQGQSVLAQWGHKCYEFVDKHAYWGVAEQWCSSNGGHLVAIESQAEQDFITGFMLKNWPHPAWIGLHDRNHEEIFEWLSGAPVTYTNWTPGRKLTYSHESEDCVFMDPRPHHGGAFTSEGMDGGWDDTDCEDTGIFDVQYSFACQYDITGYSLPPTTTPDSSATNNQSYSDGNINMCPGRLLQNASHNNIGQHGHYCYELVSSNKHTWDISESICRNHGGHLATISNQEEQNFISAFLGRHSPQHAVWIGLNDVNVEGRFEWTSGMPVNYANWVPGHLDNLESHRTEDCVVFIPYKNNVWDDMPCGHDIFFEIGEIHYAFCQYKLSSTAIIG